MRTFNSKNKILISHASTLRSIVQVSTPASRQGYRHRDRFWDRRTLKLWDRVRVWLAGRSYARAATVVSGSATNTVKTMA